MNSTWVMTVAWVSLLALTGPSSGQASVRPIVSAHCDGDTTMLECAARMEASALRADTMAARRAQDTLWIVGQDSNLPLVDHDPQGDHPGQAYRLLRNFPTAQAAAVLKRVGEQFSIVLIGRAGLTRHEVPGLPLAAPDGRHFVIISDRANLRTIELWTAEPLARAWSTRLSDSTPERAAWLDSAAVEVILIPDPASARRGAPATVRIVLADGTWTIDSGGAWDAAPAQVMVPDARSK